MLHGFTGNPASMRAVADAFVATDHHVEMPRLPGHGTTLDELRTTAWRDWAGAADDAYRRLAARADHVVIVGLSMGGSLALSTALGHPDARGLVLVNPADLRQPAAVREMLVETLEAGIEVVPRHDSDIALPGNEEINYEGTPLRQLLSLLDDGLVPMSSRYGELTMPLLLFTSHQDHVVDPADSVHLAAEYGGPVDHRWLDAQLSRRHPGLRPRRHHRRRPRVRHRRDARVIASIPSPGSNALHIGPLSLNAYGLMIALGVLAAVWLCGRRFEQRGVAKREVAGKIAIWAVTAGVIGARLYHVATDWERFEGHWFDVVKIWQGGLGIPGGMLAGVVTGVIAAKHYGIRPADAVTCAAPALPLAQAIGRWGNWFNQELLRPARPPCRGRSRSTTSTWHRATPTAPRSTRRSCTSRCGTSGCAGSCCGSTTGGSCAAGDCSGCTSSATASAAWSSRACASTPPTRSPGCGSTSGWRSCASSAASDTSPG